MTAYTYDVQDHLGSVTDAEGNTTTYAYSDRNLLTEEISPAAGMASYAYNEHGELASETDGRGFTVLRTLDALDRVTFVDTSNPAGRPRRPPGRLPGCPSTATSVLF